MIQDHKPPTKKEQIINDYNRAAQNESGGISIAEHMLKTQVHMNNIMSLTMEVLPKLADNIHKHKLRKDMQKFNANEGAEDSSELDWNATTDQNF